MATDALGWAWRSPRSRPCRRRATHPQRTYGLYRSRSSPRWPRGAAVRRRQVGARGGGRSHRRRARGGVAGPCSSSAARIGRNLVAFVLLRRGAKESLNLEATVAQGVLRHARFDRRRVGAAVGPSRMDVGRPGARRRDRCVHPAPRLSPRPRGSPGARPGRAGGVDVASVQPDLATIAGVVDVHDVHVWTLTSEMDVAHRARHDQRGHGLASCARRSARSCATGTDSPTPRCRSSPTITAGATRCPGDRATPAAEFQCVRDRADEQVRRHGQRLRDLRRSHGNAHDDGVVPVGFGTASGRAPRPHRSLRRRKPARGRSRGAGAGLRSERSRWVRRPACGRGPRRRRPAPPGMRPLAAAARTGPAAAGRTTGTDAVPSGNTVAPWACRIHVTVDPLARPTGAPAAASGVTRTAGAAGSIAVRTTVGPIGLAASTLTRPRPTYRLRGTSIGTAPVSVNVAPSMRSTVARPVTIHVVLPAAGDVTTTTQQQPHARGGLRLREAAGAAVEPADLTAAGVVEEDVTPGTGALTERGLPEPHHAVQRLRSRTAHRVEPEQPQHVRRRSTSRAAASPGRTARSAMCCHSRRATTT